MFKSISRVILWSHLLVVCSLYDTDDSTSLSSSYESLFRVPPTYYQQIYEEPPTHHRPEKQNESQYATTTIKQTAKKQTNKQPNKQTHKHPNK